jgi:hypothetical protein
MGAAYARMLRRRGYIESFGILAEVRLRHSYQPTLHERRLCFRFADTPHVAPVIYAGISPQAPLARVIRFRASTARFPSAARTHYGYREF